MSLQNSDSEETHNGEEIEDINEEDINEEKNSNDDIKTFDTLIETLYDAGLKAQRNVQIANIHNLKNFFEDTDNDGVLEPKMVKIKVPSNKGNSDWEIVDVPLFTLINHNTMKIENLQVKFKVNLTEMIKEKFKEDTLKTNLGFGLCRKRWKVRISRPIKQNVNSAEVTVDFKYDHPLESIVRLSERYSRTI